MIDVYGKGNDVIGSFYAEVLPEWDLKIYKRWIRYTQSGFLSMLKTNTWK